MKKDNFFKWWKEEGFKKACIKTKHNYLLLETPRKSINRSLMGYGFSLVGTLTGIIISLFMIKTLYWLCLIMVGAFLIQYSGMKQTLINSKQLKELEYLQKEMEVQTNEQGESNSISEKKRKKSN
jgi:hypothetical protein